MGLDQKIENVAGKLAIIVPAFEKYQGKVDVLTTQAAVFDTRLGSVEVRLCDLTLSGKEKRSRIWDVVLLVLSNLVGLAIGLSGLKMASKLAAN